MVGKVIDTSREDQKITKKKKKNRKKLQKLANHEYLMKLVREHFDEHLDLFRKKKEKKKGK